MIKKIFLLGFMLNMNLFGMNFFLDKIEHAQQCEENLRNKFFELIHEVDDTQANYDKCVTIVAISHKLRTAPLHFKDYVFYNLTDKDFELLLSCLAGRLFRHFNTVLFENFLCSLLIFLMDLKEFHIDDKLIVLRYSSEEGFCHIVEYLLRGKYKNAFKNRRDDLSDALIRASGSICPDDCIMDDFAKKLNCEKDKAGFLLASIYDTETASYKYISGEPAFKLARQQAYIKTIKLLIDAGADVNKPCRDNFTPLTLTIDLRKEPEIVMTLIQAGADVNLKDNMGLVPICEAVERSNLQITRLLIQFGADVNIKDRYGRTALQAISAPWYSNDEDHIEHIKLLLNYSDLSLKDKDGKTALEIAKLETYGQRNEAIQKQVIKLIEDKIKQSKKIKPKVD